MEFTEENKNENPCPIEEGRIGNFPDRLKEAIGEASVRSFARSAGLSETALRQYLSGKSEPTRPALVSIADAAEVSIQWLIVGEGNKEKQRFVHDFDRWVSFRYIHSMVLDTFKQNKRSEKQNAFAIFLAYFSDQQKESLIDVTLSASLAMDRTHHVIECEDKTLKEIAEDITEETFNTNYDAFNAMSEFLIKHDDVFVFCDISKSKANNKDATFHRSIIREIEKGPIDNHVPKGDVVFLDYPSFLEKNWKSLGSYVVTNILNGSSFFI